MRFFRLLRLAFWRAFEHDAFAIAKASAYSSILTFFPLLLIIGSVLASWRKGKPYLLQLSYALDSILPAGGTTGAIWTTNGLVLGEPDVGLWRIERSFSNPCDGQQSGEPSVDI